MWARVLCPREQVAFMVHAYGWALPKNKQKQETMLINDIKNKYGQQLEVYIVCKTVVLQPFKIFMRRHRTAPKPGAVKA